MNYNGLLDIDLLEAYLDGKLDAKGMHQVEKLSLEDPFVAEALAGLSQSHARSQSLSLLQKQLHQRVAQKPIENKRWTITSQRLSIASAAAVLFVTVSVLFWMKENSRRQIESNAAKSVKIEIAPTKDQLAPQPSSVTETDVVIDQAIEAAKTNTYAGIRKSKSAVKTTEVLPVTASEPVETKVDETENINFKASARMSSARIFSAEPINGWIKFEEYILQNNRLIKNNQFTDKSVQLSFTINEKNKPTNIKIANGLTKEENDEAIRLLTEGPDWKYNPNSSEVITKVTIKF